MLLLLLSRFSRLRLCATPQTEAHQAPRPWDSPGKNTGVGCHFFLQCRKVKREREVAQSCPTLHDPMDCSPPGSSIHGIFQARVLEWGAIAFSSSNPTPPLFSYVTLGELLCITKFSSLSYKMSEIIILIVGSNSILVRQARTWDHLLQCLYLDKPLLQQQQPQKTCMGLKITVHMHS